MKTTTLIKTILAGFLMVFIATPRVMSETVTVDSVHGYFWGDGGEFTVYPSAGLQGVLSGYSQGVTKNIGAGAPNFQSFCLEYNESVNPNGGHYTAVINDRAINGGLHPSMGGDPISKGTAYLYHEFQQGTLEGYDYDTSHHHRSHSAGYLQYMIWYLEDEQDYYGWNNPFKQLLIDQFGSLENAMSDNEGEFPVSVMNLWVPGHEGENRYRRQDLLVCDPVHTPEPATMILLGSGLLGLAGIARKRLKK